MSNTITQFFPSRAKAKNALKELDNATFKDFGKDAPKGERWAVLIEEVKSNSNEVNTMTEEQATANTEVNNVLTVEQSTEVVELNESAEQPTKKHRFREGTKADQVRHLVQDMITQEGVRPKDIIKAIMEQVGFSKAAATTYYYNAKKQLGL